MKTYEWRGFRYQIADEDLIFYPGAVEVKPEKPAEKAKETPKNKSGEAKKNK